MPFNITIEGEDVDYGGAPDRTDKDITLRVIYRRYRINNDIDATGNVIDFQVPVEVEVFVRDNDARGERIEPPKLIQLEKYITQYIISNKYSLQDEGINDMKILNTEKRAVDKSEWNMSSWWKLTVNVLLHYWMKYSPS